MQSRGRVGELDFADLAQLLRHGDLGLQTGELMTRVASRCLDVARSIHVLYAHHPYAVRPDFSDFHVELRLPGNLRRWIHPQAEFVIENERPFEPLPREQAPALLEWGLNWTIASTCHQWLILHAASLERGGSTLILPAPPGSGKSTLCAALALRGWRLMSDELTLLRPASLEACALARPINLKNASIDIIRGFAAPTVWAPEVYDTIKGRVTHLQPPADSVARMLETGAPRWIVFPRYVAGSAPRLTPRDKAPTFIHFAENAFNYSTLGEAGFDAVARLVDRCACYDFEYSRLDDAFEVFDWLAAGGEA